MSNSEEAGLGQTKEIISLDWPGKALVVERCSWTVMLRVLPPQPGPRIAEKDGQLDNLKQKWVGPPN